MTNITRRINVLIICILFSSPLWADNNIEEILFKDAYNASSVADSVNAAVLSPTNHAKAMDYYTDAKEKFKKGRSIEGIQKDLATAVQHFNKSIEATDIANLTLADIIASRKSAITVAAQKYANEQWNDAENIFKKAASKLESGNIKSATKIGIKAKTLYGQAELIAIKNHYLNDTRSLIEKAKKEKAKKYAPATLEKAEALLLIAEKSLDENRYDLDEPRSLAKDALYEAGHAIEITKKARKVDDNNISVEQLIITMEEPLVKISEQLNLRSQFDGTVENPTIGIHNQLGILQRDSFQLSESQIEIAKLVNEISQLEKHMGVQSDRLALQEARKQKIKNIESLFNAEEALVFIKGESVIIRMVGLNFKSGRSTIDNEYFDLLRKVKKAIDTFPNADVIVEGHTDSFGGDAQNMMLSQERAESVVIYLQANGNTNVSAQGYGETQPIGNNETAEGRLKNRRIDLVIRG